MKQQTWSELKLNITGNEIGVEKQLLKRAPCCKLFGADPIRESGEIFSTVGTYVPVAVGSFNGTRKASVLVGNGYQNKIIEHVSLSSFIDKYMNGIKLVQLLFMDAEGAEYELP